MTDRRSTGPSSPTPRSSRQVLLHRVRAATTDFSPAPVVRNYRQAGAEPQPDPDTLLEVFIDRLVDYKADVTWCKVADVNTAVAACLSAERAVRVVIPAGFPEAWLSAPADTQAETVRLDDTERLSVDELDAADGVVTTCAVAVAETGTIVLDGGAGQGRRALTLLPDLHVVVVTTEQLVARVPDALDRLDPRRPLTWISGPSATSDIELNRVEGVHGPRRLRVVVAESG